MCTAESPLRCTIRGLVLNAQRTAPQLGRDRATTSLIMRLSAGDAVQLALTISDAMTLAKMIRMPAHLSSEADCLFMVLHGRPQLYIAAAQRWLVLCVMVGASKLSAGL